MKKNGSTSTVVVSGLAVLGFIVGCGIAPMDDADLRHDTTLQVQRTGNGGSTVQVQRPGSDSGTAEIQTVPAADTSVDSQSIARSPADSLVAAGTCGGWGAWRYTGATNCTHSWECPYCPPRGPCTEIGPAREKEQRRCKNLCPDQCETQWVWSNCGCR